MIDAPIIAREDADVAEKERRGRTVAAGEAWLSVRVPETVKERIERIAEREERSVSFILRRLVLEALEGDKYREVR